MQHADFALLHAYLGLDDVDLLLSLDCLTLDLLDELIWMLVNKTLGASLMGSMMC